MPIKKSSRQVFEEAVVLAPYPKIVQFIDVVHEKRKELSNASDKLDLYERALEEIRNRINGFCDQMEEL